jgi:hypothetical protein
MQSLYTLKNEKEVKFIRAISKELTAEKQTVLLTIRLMDQITSKLWSSQVRGCVDDRGYAGKRNIMLYNARETEKNHT